MPARTLIYPVFLPMQGCRGRCIYCDQARISGAGEFDLHQALSGAQAFVERNHSKEKQIAFYGGSFTALAQGFRNSLLDEFRRIADEETTFRISTHPLYIDPGILDWCAQKWIRTIELGIQDFHTEVLMRTGRGYTREQALEAAELVQERGFELGVQLMPGLPGWTEQSIRCNHQVLAQLKPRYLRLYPLIVIRETPLAELFQQCEYLPLTLDEAVRQCADFFPLAAEHGITIIKVGIPSNLDPAEVLAGPWHPAFGELVKAELLCRRIIASKPSEGMLRLEKQELALLKSYSPDRLLQLSELIGC